MHVAELVDRLDGIVRSYGGAANFVVGVFVSGRGRTEPVKSLYALLGPRGEAKEIVLVGDAELAHSGMSVRDFSDCLRALRPEASVLIDSANAPSFQALDRTVRVIHVSSAGMIVLSDD
jgi:hypothetical protein